MHGKVVRVDKDEVLVDIGYKSEGVIPVSELSIRRSINPADEVTLGDEIDALVLTKEDAEGRLILSKKRARFEMAWKAIEQAAESGQPVDRQGDRGRQGRPDPRPRRARLPARVARRHPPRPGPRRVPRQGAPLQGDRAQPLAEQRRPLAPRRPRGRAQGDAPGDPRPAQPGRRRRGPDLEHRRLRRVRRPRRHGRPDPHLRALVVARQPSVRGARDRPDRQGQGARHRPRPPADLARPQADADRPVAAGAGQLRRGRRRPGPRDEGGHVRRLRRDPPRRRGARAHLRARAAPRREPARGRLAGRSRQREDHRGRRRAPPPLALAEADRGGRADAAAARGRRAAPPAIDLSEEVFADAAGRRASGGAIEEVPSRVADAGEPSRRPPSQRRRPPSREAPSRRRRSPRRRRAEDRSSRRTHRSRRPTRRRRPSSAGADAERAQPRPLVRRSPSPSPAASERARARRCGRSRAAASRRCRPTRSSTG